jgi:hypothetical protein
MGKSLRAPFNGTVENIGLEQLRFNGVYDKMIKVITGRTMLEYGEIRRELFDIYFNSFDSNIEKIRTYTGQAELD